MSPGMESGGSGGGVNNLRELRKRQAELTNIALNSSGALPHEAGGRSWSNEPVSNNLHAAENWSFKKPDSSSPPSSNLGGTRTNHNLQEEKTYNSDDFVRPPIRRPDHTATVPRPPPVSPESQSGQVDVPQSRGKAKAPVEVGHGTAARAPAGGPARG